MIIFIVNVMIVFVIVFDIVVSLIDIVIVMVVVGPIVFLTFDYVKPGFSDSKQNGLRF